MSASLIERLRASRESQVTTSGGRTFRVRRPTGVQAHRIAGDADRLLRAALVGWDLREIDLVPGGTDEPVPFDVETCIEWLEDRPSEYGDVVRAVDDLMMAYLERIRDAEKK